MQLRIRLIDTFEKPFEMQQDVHHILKRLGNLGTGAEDFRKFIVLAKISDAADLTLIIGPALLVDIHHKDAYRHSLLRQCALHILDKDGGRYEIKGGGNIKFVRFNVRWSAYLGGASGDYGVYDKQVLSKMREVADWLGMAVNFTWSDTIYPTPKK